MTPVSPNLARIKARFERTRNDQEVFILSLPSMHKRAGKRSTSINSTQKERLCEMAFAILFTAWEQFLETAFETYVVDAPFVSIKSRHRVLVVDLETAHDLILGGRRYVEWADSSLVRERARIFFKNGEPFESALSAVTDDLTKMKIIRNRCVHLSQHAAEQYTKMVRQVFGSGRQISPGSLLLNSPPRGLSSASSAQTYGTVFQLYSAILSTASSQIVPGRP